MNGNRDPSEDCPFVVMKGDMASPSTLKNRTDSKKPLGSLMPPKSKSRKLNVRLALAAGLAKGEKRRNIVRADDSVFNPVPLPASEMVPAVPPLTGVTPNIPL